MFRFIGALFLALLGCLTLAETSVADDSGSPDWVLECRAPWQPRDSQAEFAFGGRIWIMGGWFNSFAAPPRDVWSSSDGREWKLVSKDAPWLHSDLPMNISFQNKMWMMGGWYNGRLPGHSASNQVWSSTDGAEWKQETAAAGWTPRIAAGLVEFRGRMWLLGGTENYYFGDEKSLKNDVWSSADGKTWKLETANAEWSPRAYHQAAVLNDRIYIFGGGNYVPKYHGKNDVWSSADGVHWTCETESAEWSPRLWFSTAVYRDHLWVMGGWSNNPSKNWGDVWYSRNGKNWHRLITKSCWKERHEHSAFVFQDKLWIAGGHAQPLSNEVWSLEVKPDYFAKKETEPKTESQDPSSKAIAYPDHSQLLVVRDSAGTERPIRSQEDWRIRAEHIRESMKLVMGNPPEKNRWAPLQMEVVSEQKTSKYLRQKIRFTPEIGDRVPAWLLIPNQLVGNEKLPAMLCLHQTTRIGKDEPAGLGGLSSLHYAHELAERGYVCLVPDYPSFGEYSYDFKKQGSHYASGSMKAIWNNQKAIDLLQSLPQVAGERIGVIGHSLGGHNAMFTAAFDERIRMVISSCGFTPFHDYYGGKVAGWTSDRYMPRIRDVYENDANKIPFDFYEIVGLIAPRGFFSNSPIRDSNFEIKGVRKAFEKAAAVFELFGANQKLKLVSPDAPHDFPEAERMAAYDWLDAQLKQLSR